MTDTETVTGMRSIWVLEPRIRGDQQDLLPPLRIWFDRRPSTLKTGQELDRSRYRAWEALLGRARTRFEDRQAELRVLTGAGCVPMLDALPDPGDWMPFEEWVLRFGWRTGFWPKQIGLLSEPAGNGLVWVAVDDRGAAHTASGSGEDCQLWCDQQAYADIEQYRKAKAAHEAKLDRKVAKRAERRRQRQLIVDAGLTPTFGEPKPVKPKRYPTYETWRRRQLKRYRTYTPTTYSRAGEDL